MANALYRSIAVLLALLVYLTFGAGGAFAIIIIDNSLFSNNTAIAADGGDVFHNAVDSLAITNSQFLSNPT